MFRAIFELFLTLLVAYVGRAIIGSLLKGFGAAASGGFQQQPQQPKQEEAPRAGELHKDPVCGTYVSESSHFRRQLSGKTVYYCSDACRQKHAV
jgi:YHS domain-containing protein